MHAQRPSPPNHSDDYGISPSSYEKATQPKSQWNPRAWTKKAKIIVGAVVAAVIVIVAVVVGAVLGTRNNRSYPEYSELTYHLEDDYSGPDFFNDFDFFNEPDPTNGFLHYVLEDAATQPAHNLTYASEDSAFLRVDTTSDEYDTNTGRWSVRIVSKKQYNSGLFIFDVLHSPFGCGTWPALWICDHHNWPDNGEIDVAESVNRATDGNQFTLHTSDGCTMSNVRREHTGESLGGNCLYSANNNEGCGVKGPEESSGEAFNQAGGGVYATEWRDDGIRMWFFGRGEALPDDLMDDNLVPNPANWPEATADFPNTRCDIGDHFRNASIIMNIALCGEWAGAKSVYSDAGNCPGSCPNFVADNASAFEEAYWEIKSVRVYSAEY